MYLNSNQNKSAYNWTFSNFLRLLSLEAFAVVVYYLLLPGDPKNSLMFGYSVVRLGLIVLFALIAILLFVFASKAGKSSTQPGWLDSIIKPTSFSFLLFLTVLFSVASVVAIGFPMEFSLSAIMQRLAPILVWISIVLIESVFMLADRWFGVSWKGKIDKRLLKSWLLLLLCFFLIWVFISITKSGQSPDPVSWREMGSPILAWQIGVAVLIGGFASLIIAEVERSNPNSRCWIEAVIMLGLYGIAIWIWLGQPLQYSYFSPRVKPPNQEVYPYSDALYYNLAAESVTLGEGLLMHSVTPRPLYLTILTYMIQLTNGDYSGIITIQTLWLGLIPVVLYLIGKRILNRGVGISLALLSIFRELVAIQATVDIQLSNSKLIMADLPTFLFLLIFTYFVIDWFKAKTPDIKQALWVGASLGTLMLFRTQAVILLPFVLIAGLYQFKSVLKNLYFQLGMIVIACFLVICPWLVRNYMLTGQVMFDDPVTQTSFLQGRYQLGEDGETQSGSILSSFMKHPVEVVKFVANHFFRNEIGTIFVTPPQRLIGTWPLLFSQTTFWTENIVALTISQQIGLMGILALIALGIVSIVSRTGMIGLTPLVINLAYTLGNGLARNSGGRYNLPVDWVGYFYLVMGIVQLATWLLAGLGQQSNARLTTADISNNTAKSSWKRIIALCIGFVTIGSVIPLTEAIYQQRYPPVTPESVTRLMEEWGANDPQLLAEINSNEVTLRYGRELFPRFYRPGDGEQGSKWAAYAPYDFCRMGFELIDTDRIGAVVVTLDRPPAYFPSRMDAVVVGEETTGLVKGKPEPLFAAKWIVLHTDPVTIVRGLDTPPDRCRLKP